MCIVLPALSSPHREAQLYSFRMLDPTSTTRSLWRHREDLRSSPNYKEVCGGPPGNPPHRHWPTVWSPRGPLPASENLWWKLLSGPLTTSRWCSLSRKRPGRWARRTWCHRWWSPSLVIWGWCWPGWSVQIGAPPPLACWKRCCPEGPSRAGNIRHGRAGVYLGKPRRRTVKISRRLDIKKVQMWKAGH